MSIQGLSNLVTAIMAAGAIDALPARNHRSCHQALVRLLDDQSAAAAAIWGWAGGRPTTTRDSSVGTRVKGVTPALWVAVNEGRLVVREPDSEGARFELTHSARRSARRDLMRLPAEQTELIYGTAMAWARPSTSRKKAARAAGSLAGTRRVRLA